MNNKEYIAFFSSMNTSVEIKLEDYEKMKMTKKVSFRRTIIIAATICLILAMSTVAIATGIFGIKDRALPEDINRLAEQKIRKTFENTDLGDDFEVHMISMLGTTDSIEYKAMVEWEAFCLTYDQDAKIIKELGNSYLPLFDEYGGYSVYTNEMSEKLEEIAAKYNLKLKKNLRMFSQAREYSLKNGESVDPHPPGVDLNYNEFMNTISTGSLINDEVECLSGYVYDDGTFLFEGTLGHRSINKNMSFSFHSYEKGTLHDTGIINADTTPNSNEWQYETKHGFVVSISQINGFGFIFLELDDKYIAITTDALMLESLADCFDFSKIK